MRLSGLHLLLTYKCNARCRHCFLSAGPHEKRVMAYETAVKYLDDAAELPVSHFFVEGGEPFLYPDLLEAVVREASRRGYWIGALTNGFWASSPERAARILTPLVDAGLKSLGVSTDAFHEEFVPLDNVLLAANTASDLGLSTDLMVCLEPGKTAVTGQSGRQLAAAEAQGVPVYAGGIVCRGRAVLSALCSTGTIPWTACTTCEEHLSDPSRVHLGPDGEIHLCQGLLIGEKGGTRRLKAIFAGYEPGSHPVVGALLAGGPAELARFAMLKGFEPQPAYVDACHLCYEVRRFLRPLYPQFLGPAAIYSD